jgi:RNA polymerase sigma-70 factor (ECF subfamily)|tara:strand:- start:1585 stop:2151 length:567 start_codon:yes stop_codon:yes gene_type:complete
VHKAQDHYPDCPEALIVSLARTGDRSAFADLVRRRQSSIRNLMRRFCSDTTLADDLAQQVFLQVWRKIHTLKQANAFSAWLKRLAVSVWLQHVRKKDALRGADEPAEDLLTQRDSVGVGMDLDHALSTLSDAVRSCVVLSYHEGMSHGEIAKFMDLPLGTVKSHINRGTERLRQILAAYKDTPDVEES